tara:strand:- start:1048 stop:1239 length:192 start_codon:yes stop_codon:yes gene_type:complete
MNFIKKFWNNLTGTEEIIVRSRTAKGKFVADDKSTPDVNEAYTTKRVKRKSKSTKITTDNIGE